MSQENVELVRRLVDAWNRRDLDAMLDLGGGEEIAFVNSPTAVEPGTRRGRTSSAPQRGSSGRSWPTAEPRLTSSLTAATRSSLWAVFRVACPGAMIGSRSPVSSPTSSAMASSTRVEVLGFGRAENRKSPRSRRAVGVVAALVGSRLGCGYCANAPRSRRAPASRGACGPRSGVRRCAGHAYDGAEDE